MQILRTPPERFAHLPDYDFAPHYAHIPHEGQTLHMHYVDEGPRDAPETVVLLHGQPSWSFLYRHVIPPLAAAGYRVVAPDLIGFGKSDKLGEVSDYTYARQETWLWTALFDVLDLRDVTLYAQDWGGLLSLRIVAFHPEYFRRVMIANTALPPGDKDSNLFPDDAPRRRRVTLGAKAWGLFARRSPVFPIGRIAALLAPETDMSRAVRAGYDAPFPSNAYKTGARAMPDLIPLRTGNPDGRRNREAWTRLATFDKPFRTAFSDGDFSVKLVPECVRHVQQHVAGARGQNHVTIPLAGHFLQEEQPALVAAEIIRFVEETTP